MKASEPEKSQHHLFTYHEVRQKLVQVFGEPITDQEHRQLHKEIFRVRKLMPKYLIDHELHKRIHKPPQSESTLEHEKETSEEDREGNKRLF